MGPASLRAIKEGEINQLYDTSFVLAEVNADRMYWQKNQEGNWEVVDRNNTAIGKSDQWKKKEILYKILYIVSLLYLVRNFPGQFACKSPV